MQLPPQAVIRPDTFTALSTGAWRRLIPDPLTSSAYRHCQTMNTQASPFVFRAADQMRITGCVNALAKDAMNLAICCEQEALLDHYLDLLLQQLSDQAPWLQQEIYFPTNTEYLLARFNELLASQSVQDATLSGDGRREARVWIVHDAQSLPEPELQLLARLIQNFPGANIRALLVMAGPSTRHPQLSAFGRKILKWDIEPPGHEQALLALEAAASGPERALIERLLRKMGHLSSAASIPEPPGSNAADAEAGSNSPIEETEADPRWSARLSGHGHKLIAWANARKSSLPELSGLLKTLPHTHGRLLLVGLGLLLCSVLLTVFLQPQTFGIGSGSSPKNEPEVVAEQVRKQASEETTGLTRPAAETAPSPDTPRNSGAVSPPAANAPMAGDLPVGHDWARQLAPLSFVLQHASVTNLARAQAIIKANPALRQSKVVITYRQGDAAPQYLVLSGPFEPVGQAYEKARTPGMPSGTWVRSSADMQSQLKIPAAFLESPR